jgi:hypothetical protein
MLTKQQAYEKWLGIKADDQPPNLYRLLGIDAFATDPEIISNASDRQTGFVRQFQIGENAKLSVEILNELSRARVILLNAEKKAAYDAKLRAKLSPNPLPQAQPLAPVSAEPARPASEGPEQPIDSGKPRASYVAAAPLVTESTPAGRSKLPAKPAKSKNRLVIAGAIGGVSAICLIVGSIYAFMKGWPGASTNAGNTLPAAVPSQPVAASAASAGSGQIMAAASVPDAAKPGKSSGVVRIASVVPVVPPEPPGKVYAPQPYNEQRLAKDVEEIKRLFKAIKSYSDSLHVADQGLVLADRAIALGKPDTAKEVAAVSLAAARIADSLPLTRQATVLLIQLQHPLSDAMKQAAKKRLSVETDDAAVAEETAPKGPSLPKDDSPNITKAGSHDARWGKTEAQRRKVFYDLLKAVDDYGMTPEGRKAWKAIQARYGIDAGVTLGILNEGFSTLSDWDQPDGGGKASSRMNRMEWVGARTRSMTEPMLKE